jgi:hypothetical protein
MLRRLYNTALGGHVEHVHVVHAHCWRMWCMVLLSHLIVTQPEMTSNLVIHPSCAVLQRRVSDAPHPDASRTPCSYLDLCIKANV